jgi:hypothetical protein
MRGLVMKIAAVTVGLALSLAGSASAEVFYSSVPDFYASPIGSVTVAGGSLLSTFTINEANSTLTGIKFIITQTPDAVGADPFKAIRFGIANSLSAWTCCFNTYLLPDPTYVSWTSVGGGNYLIDIDLIKYTQQIGLGNGSVLQPGDYFFQLSSVGPSGNEPQSSLTIPLYSGSGSAFLAIHTGTTPVSGTAAFSLTGAVNPVPEPATWGLLIVGFGLIGFRLRGRRSSGSSVRLAA